jgi:DNA-binding FadR family transcriptional regulator
VVEKLRREILLGRYQPGTRLPPERELALKLGTNRNTLREALRTLESEKLVRARQGDGTLVLDWRAVGEINLLPHFLAEETPIDDRFEALYTLFRLRDQLIDQAVHFATGADVDNDGELRALRRALDELRVAESGTVAAVHADIELYRRLVLASRTTVLVWVFNTFARIFTHLGERYPELWKLDRAYVDAVDDVLRLIEGGNEPAARKRMFDLLELRSGVILRQLIPEKTPTSEASATKPRIRKRKR